MLLKNLHGVLRLIDARIYADVFCVTYLSLFSALLESPPLFILKKEQTEICGFYILLKMLKRQCPLRTLIAILYFEKEEWKLLHIIEIVDVHVLQVRNVPTSGHAYLVLSGSSALCNISRKTNQYIGTKEERHQMTQYVNCQLISV